METDLTLSSSDEYADQPIDAITLGFNRQLDLQSHDASSSSSSSKLLPNKEVVVDEQEEENEEEEEDDDDDFTFMFVGTDDTATDGEKVLEDGQMFPLFDQKLLLDGEYEVEEIDRLPIQPPVDKIFIKSPTAFPSSENEETLDGPYCVWSKESTTATSELSKKSNSTGFSKLWRLKDRGGRSNSYGRDAFVFFKSSSDKKTATGSSSTSATTVDGTFKVNVAGGKAKVVRKGTKSKVSALEAYLKSREEDRRRSYQPYRSEQMGFFTNVQGGLTKNVHPY